MLVFLTGVISALSFIVSLSHDYLLHPKSPLEWVNLALFLVALFCIICSWGHALLAIKVGDCPILPKSRASADYIMKSSEEESLDYVYGCYVSTLELLSDVIDEKSINLTHSYEELTLSAWFLGLLGLITIFMEIAK